jgi:hypothetical protein
MQDLNDDNFDTLLRDHFARKLNGQLGKAQAALGREHRARRWRRASVAGLAMAAAIAGFVLLRPSAPPANVVPPVATASDISVPGEYEMSWQTIDQGTVFLDEDTPMRRLLRRGVEQVRWIDPATQASVEYTVPHDEIVLVALNTI